MRIWCTKMMYRPSRRPSDDRQCQWEREQWIRIKLQVNELCLIFWCTILMAIDIMYLNGIWWFNERLMESIMGSQHNSTYNLLEFLFCECRRCRCRWRCSGRSCTAANHFWFICCCCCTYDGRGHFSLSLWLLHEMFSLRFLLFNFSD